MNNDITNLTPNYLNIKNVQNTSPAPNAQILEEKENFNKNLENNSIYFLGSLGRTKVNMDNAKKSPSTKEFVKDFLKDPQKAEFENHFCDKLTQEAGLSLEEALIATDKVFRVLKSENTYK